MNPFMNTNFNITTAVPPPSLPPLPPLPPPPLLPANPIATSIDHSKTTTYFCFGTPAAFSSFGNTIVLITDVGEIYALTRDMSKKNSFVKKYYGSPSRYFSIDELLAHRSSITSSVMDIEKYTAITMIADGYYTLTFVGNNLGYLYCVCRDFGTPTVGASLYCFNVKLHQNINNIYTVAQNAIIIFDSECITLIVFRYGTYISQYSESNSIPGMGYIACDILTSARDAKFFSKTPYCFRQKSIPFKSCISSRISDNTFIAVNPSNKLFKVSVNTGFLIDISEIVSPVIPSIKCCNNTFKSSVTNSLCKFKLFESANETEAKFRKIYLYNNILYILTEKTLFAIDYKYYNMPAYCLCSFLCNLSTPPVSDKLQLFMFPFTVIDFAIAKSGDVYILTPHTLSESEMLQCPLKSGGAYTTILVVNPKSCYNPEDTIANAAPAELADPHLNFSTLLQIQLNQKQFKSKLFYDGYTLAFDDNEALSIFNIL